MEWCILTPYRDESAERRAHRGCLAEFKRRSGVPHHSVRHSSVIDQARCALAEMALATDCAGFLWIDGDISFDLSEVVPFVQRAMASDSAIVGGIYAHKKRGSGQLACQFGAGVRKVLAYERGYYPAVGVAFGWAFTKRSAFERLGLEKVNSPFFPPLRPFFLPAIHGGRYLQEDYAFTRRVLDAGMTCSIDAEPRLLHEGPYWYGIEDALAASERPAHVLITLPTPPDEETP